MSQIFHVGPSFNFMESRKIYEKVDNKFPVFLS